MKRLHYFLRGIIFFNPVFILRLRWIWPAIIIGFVFSGSVALAAEKKSGLPSLKADPPSEYSLLSGTWKGVYFIYPHLMCLELQLNSESNGAVSGVLKYYPAVKSRNAFGEPKQGSYHISGQFNESSRSFLLKPGAWIEKPNMAGSLAPIAGVLDARANKVAGIFEFPSAPNPVFFILAPETGADKLIAEITNSAYPAPLPLAAGWMRHLFDLLEWAPPPVDRLLDWASRLKQEMPALDLRSTVMEKIYLPARNLFADDYFKDHFGLTYEEMDTAQRKAVAGAFSQHGRELSGYDFLARPFQNVGDFGAPDITVSIRWQGVLRSWARDLQTSFAAMPAEVNSFSEMNVAEAAANTELPFLWPSEKDRFNSALTGARTRLAGPVLTLRADRLIATASGNAGARELVGWRTQEKDILQYVSTTEQDKLQQRIDTQLDKILGQLVAANIRSLATIGHGLDAVLAGNKWYREVERSYDFALTRPPIQAALLQFQQVRAENLIEAKPSIIAQLDGAKQESQVQSILGNYLICPGDDASETGVAIRQHAKQRLGAVAAARVGDGPFGPDYPGAAYLNALYRNDTARLVQEDRAVSEPLARSMAQMLRATGMDALTSFFSGGAVPKGGLTQLMTDQMRSFSIAVPLTGFFIVAYERVYPKCMDANPVVFEQTTTWDTVVTNGFGNVIARYPHSETNYYNVNKRHADAFRKVGPGTNPDQLDFTTQLFGPLLSKDVTVPQHTVTDTLRGLRIAMTQNACDSPLIKTLEKNMIAHVMAN